MDWKRINQLIAVFGYIILPPFFIRIKYGKGATKELIEMVAFQFLSLLLASIALFSQ